MPPTFRRWMRRVLGSLASRLADHFSTYSTTMKQQQIESAFSRWNRVRRTPAAAPTTTAARSALVKKETAALSIDAPDVCPYCKKKMQLSEAVGLPVYVCFEDRNVAPAPNDVTLKD